MAQRIPVPQFNNPLIRMNGRCPACNTAYDFQRLRILAEKDQSLLTYLECGSCRTAVLSLLQLGALGLSAQVLVTDLTPDEVYRRLDVGRLITSDEVIELHTFLENDNTIGSLLNP